MKLQKAIETIEIYNRWRRGEDVKMIHPKHIGKAIDTVVKHYKKTE
jgi:hypothetical protein